MANLCKNVAFLTNFENFYTGFETFFKGNETFFKNQSMFLRLFSKKLRLFSKIRPLRKILEKGLYIYIIEYIEVNKAQTNWQVVMKSCFFAPPFYQFVCLLIIWQSPIHRFKGHSQYVPVFVCIRVVIVAPPSIARYPRLLVFPSANQNQPIDKGDQSLSCLAARMLFGLMSPSHYTVLKAFPLQAPNAVTKNVAHGLNGSTC